MHRRWHLAPRITALVLLIPLAATLIGVSTALTMARGPEELAAALAGRNQLLAPMLTRLVAWVALGVLAAAAIITVHRMRTRQPAAIRQRFLRSPGWADRERDNPNSPRGIKARLGYLLPNATNPQVSDASVPLGRDARGRTFLLTCDESVLVIGPPGSGKDRRVAGPVLAAWPGPVLATSTKTDLAEATWQARAARGPIAVFDPAGFGLEAGSTLRWNPVTGCEDKDVAARRAAAIIAGGMPSMNEQFWATAATRILRATLHAAALSTGSILDACGWATNPTGWIAASEILRAHGAHEWAAALRDDADLDPRTSSSIAATLTGTLIGLSNAKLRSALAPLPAEAPVDLAALLAASGTIYAIAPAEPDSHLVYRPWTTLLASEIAATLREQAHGRRLEPPALLLLNELVHVCPLPELPGLLADGRGHNIATMAIVQDPAQLAARYTPDQARAITAAAQHRLLLSAGSDDTAREWSELIGTYRMPSRSRTHRPMGFVAQSSSTSLEQVPIMPAHELRHLPYGCAVMLPRGQPAIPLELFGD
ncbi:MAG: type IV secretory system conjugative DNA transfer family protein [Candidatus Nanopelagicales bacterium]|nr:type IV secretory system conjugative DNA transfer family protein [Candidatus Nanopelagicales bacterium]